MSKQHLGASGVVDQMIAGKFDAEERRAQLMGQRFIEGLKTLDAAGRRVVFQSIANQFCTGCGSTDPACRCKGQEQ